MSRIAKNPVRIPAGVEVSLSGNTLVVKGSKGALTSNVHPSVRLEVDKQAVTILSDPHDKTRNALSGTARATINNMVVGVSAGYEKKLTLVGVGYRAQAKGDVLALTLGFSHPVEFPVPAGITVETPSQTEIVVKGCDRQSVGQVAANIRAYRPPEPYKGKGIRYSDEEIIRKEAKKK
jgi:large subunit ribosomal protein L6